MTYSFVLSYGPSPFLGTALNLNIQIDCPELTAS
jgi:hypothetical protein